jgi:hypothetical protein
VCLLLPISGIRCSCEYLVHGVDTPASAVAGSDARFIQMLSDRLDAHRSGGVVALARQAISVAGYDGMHLIYEALKKTNGSTNGSKLVEAMKGLEWESPRGPMSVHPETRDVIQNIYLCRVEKIDGELYNSEFVTFQAVKDPIKETKRVAN